MELLGQGPEGLREQRQLLGVDGHLARLGLEHEAFHAHDVADIPGLEGGVGFLAHVVPFHVDLDVALAVQDMGEAGLAHDAFGHHAAGDAHLFVLVSVEVRLDVGAVGILVVANDGEGVLALRHQGGELVTTDLKQLRELLRGDLLVLFRTLFHVDFSSYALMQTISSVSRPPGVCTSTFSPALWPSSAAPMGDSLEILPLRGSASVVPTIW